MPSCGITKVFDTFDRIKTVVGENQEATKDIIKSIGEITESTNKVVGQVTEKIDSVMGTISAADTDKDGELSWGEIITMILGGGGGIGLLARNKASGKAKDEKFAEIKAESKDLREKLTTIQIEMAKGQA